MRRVSVVVADVGTAPAFITRVDDVPSERAGAAAAAATFRRVVAVPSPIRVGPFACAWPRSCEETTCWLLTVTDEGSVQ